MKIYGKEINDECKFCGKILECSLFKEGHGIECERINVTKMLACQIEHMRERKKNEM